MLTHHFPNPARPKSVPLLAFSFFLTAALLILAMPKPAFAVRALSLYLALSCLHYRFFESLALAPSSLHFRNDFSCETMANPTPSQLCSHF